MAMTVEEQRGIEGEILSLLCEVFNLFRLLPELHSADLDETARDIHNLQNRIMARGSMRNG